MPIRIAATLAATATLAWSLGASAAGQQEVPAPGSPSAVAARADAIRTEQEAALRQRFLPKRLPRERLERLPAEFAFNAEAVELFPRVIERYEAMWQQIDGEESRQIEVLLPAAFRFDHGRGEFEEVHTPELLSVLRIRDRLGARIDAAEEALARELSALCSPEKANDLARFRLARVRELYGLPARLPAAGVDLVELIGRAGLSAEEVEPLKLGFAQYTERYGEAMRRRHRQLLELEREEAEALVALGPEWRVARPAEEAEEIDRQLAQIAVAFVLADLPLRDLNQTTIQQFRRQLVPAAARKVMDAYHRVVHPGLFEDERAFQGLISDLIALPTATPEQVTAVVDLSASLEERMRQGGQQAVELADGAITASRLPTLDAVAARVLLDAKLQGVLTRRRAAIRDGYRQIALMLSGEQVAFAKRLDDAIATLGAQDRASAFLIASLEERGREIAIFRTLAEEAVLTPPEPPLPPPPHAEPIPEAPPANTDEPAPPVDDRPRRGSRGGR